MYEEVKEDGPIEEPQGDDAPVQYRCYEPEDDQDHSNDASEYAEAEQNHEVNIEDPRPISEQIAELSDD